MVLKVLGSVLVLLSSVLWRCQATELMFELPDRDRQCFYEDIEKGVSCTLEYQASPVPLVLQPVVGCSKKTGGSCRF